VLKVKGPILKWTLRSFATKQDSGGNPALETSGNARQKNGVESVVKGSGKTTFPENWLSRAPEG